MSDKLTYKKAINKAAIYCSKSEKCKLEVIKKLYKWNANENEFDEIIAFLEKEKYINDTRFACFYVRDKFRFNKWGRIKISAELRNKKISDEDIKIGLKEIDNEKYCQELKHIIDQKNKSLKEENIYKRSQKLIAFAMNKGYEQDLVFSVVNESIIST